MNKSIQNLVVTIINENDKEIKISSKNIITLDQIKSKYQNEYNLSEEELEYLTFWCEDGAGNKYYIENNEDISSIVERIFPNSLSLTLYSEILKGKNININDNNIQNIQNKKTIEDTSKNEKKINCKENESYLDFDKNKIGNILNENQNNKYEELLNAKNKEIELLKREISKLKKEDEKYENHEKNGNYNKEEIENIISQQLNNFEKKINEKFNELKLVAIKNVGLILQEISNLDFMSNNNTKNLVPDINSNANLNNENIINEIINNENNNNEINDFEFIANENNNNIINNNIPTGNKINENNKIDVKKKTLTEKEKKEKLKNREKQIDSYNKLLQELFFTKKGAMNLNKLDLKTIHKKIPKIFTELKNCGVDPFEYFIEYKQYFMMPIINDLKSNSEEKEILKMKITQFSDEIQKYLNS